MCMGTLRGGHAMVDNGYFWVKCGCVKVNSVSILLGNISNQQDATEESGGGTEQKNRTKEKGESYWSKK